MQGHKLKGMNHDIRSYKGTFPILHIQKAHSSEWRHGAKSATYWGKIAVYPPTTMFPSRFVVYWSTLGSRLEVPRTKAISNSTRATYVAEASTLDVINGRITVVRDSCATTPEGYPVRLSMKPKVIAQSCSGTQHKGKDRANVTSEFSQLTKAQEEVVASAPSAKLPEHTRKDRSQKVGTSRISRFIERAGERAVSENTRTHVSIRGSVRKDVWTDPLRAFGVIKSAWQLRSTIRKNWQGQTWVTEQEMTDGSRKPPT